MGDQHRQRCSGSRGRTVDLRARIGSRGRRLQPEQVDADEHGAHGHGADNVGADEHGADDVGTGEHGAKGYHHPDKN